MYWRADILQTDVVRKKQFDIKDNVKFNGNVLKSKAFVSKNIFIIIMVLGCMMGSFSHTAFSSMLENIMKEFNLSASKSQLMTAVYSMTIGVTTILSVFLTKYFDKKKLFEYRRVSTANAYIWLWYCIVGYKFKLCTHNNRKNFSGCRQWSGSYIVSDYITECIFKRKNRSCNGNIWISFKSFIRRCTCCHITACK